MPIPRALTIAGSDSGGGAGIQADLKAFARCGVHGTAAITAVTAQNTLGISAIHVVPPAIVSAQIEAVLEDIGADAVKIGMLATAETIRAVAGELRERLQSAPLVIDPVLTASTGGELLNSAAVETMIGVLFPLATVITPNLRRRGRCCGTPVTRRHNRRTTRSSPRRCWRSACRASC